MGEAASAVTTTSKCRRRESNLASADEDRLGENAGVNLADAEGAQPGRVRMRQRNLLWPALPAVAVAVAAVAAASPRAATGQRAASRDFALFVSYRVTRVPSVASGLYRAAGTFTATGRVSDSGTAASAYRITARGPDTVRSAETFRGRRGRLVVRFQASVVSVGKRKINQRPGPDRVVGVGIWRVVSGTGAYAGLRRRTGTVGYTIDFRRRRTSTLYLLR